MKHTNLTGSMKIFLAFFFAFAACAMAQPAPYPLTINSQAATAPQLDAFRASPKTVRVQFMDGTNRVDLTTLTSNDVFLSWSPFSTSTTRVVASARIHNVTNGQVDFTFAVSNLNYAPGRYLYECGISNAVVRQGILVINGSPYGTGAQPISFATSVNWNAISWVNLPAYITDAPADATTYGRKSNAWVSVGGGGGSGTFTNFLWNTNANTAQAIVKPESNIVFRSAGGTNYAALAGNLAGDFTFNGAINANDNIEIANTKHLRFQDGGGTNTVHLAATAGRLIITGAVDIVSGQAVPATINGAQIATASDVSARLASNVWAAADSTTNYFRRTGDSVPYISFAIASPPLNNATTIGYGLNGRGNSDFVIFQTEANGTYFDMVNPVTFNGLVISDVGFSGDGSGLTGLNGASITNLSAFSTVRTNGTGNVVTNLTFGGSVITQQMGTVTGGGGGAAAISNAFVHFNLGAARNATNNGMGLARGYLDTDTATSDIFPAFFVTVSSNVVQDAYAKAWIRWPVANPTQIQLRVWYQGNTNNPLEARFSNGTNAVAYVLGAASADALNTITLTPSGFLTSVVENAAVQLRISAAFASTSSVPMGRGIEEGIWVRR